MTSKYYGECEPIQLKDVKLGEFIILSLNVKAVYTRGEYDRECKRYSCGDYNDISKERLLSGKRIVYVGFTY